MKKYFLVLFFLSCSNSFAHNSEQEDGKNAAPVILAPGYNALTFDAPLAGSYQLPPLGSAGNGQVLDRKGEQKTLEELLGDKVVLLSFIYATCSDVNGCPLATSVFHKIKNRLSKESALVDDLRLLTLSFDPVHDTPKAMSEYSESLTSESTDWRFLTTKSQKQLQPILKQYNQVIQQEYDEKGNSTGTFSHTLRVYLIDKNKKIRNIYNIGFLHPDILINDVKTLLLEDEKNAVPTNKINSNLHGAGDVKTGYETEHYQTNSKSLKERKGVPADLMELVMNPPQGLPKVSSPENNPLKKKQLI